METNKNNLTVIVMAAVALSAAAVGYGVGRWQDGEPEEEHGYSATGATGKVEVASSRSSSQTNTPERRREKASGTNPAADDGSGYSKKAFEAKLLEMGDKAKRGRWDISSREHLEWMKMVDAVNPRDIPEWLTYIDNNLDSNSDYWTRQPLLERLAEADLAAALSYADGLPTRQKREWAYNIVINSWAKRDSASALAWARKLPKGNFRDQLINSIAYTVGQKNPGAALDIAEAEGLQKSQRWGWGYGQVFSAWAADDPLAAAARAAKLPSARTRSDAYRSIAEGWARENPTEAFNWVNKLDVGNKARIMDAVFSSWPENDLDNALAYADLIENKATKNQVDRKSVV